MKKFILIATALSVIGLAAPAAAQDRYGNNAGYGYGYGQGVESRTDHLRQRLQIGIQRGTISRQEATYLRDGIHQLTRLERHYSRGGFDRQERRDLQGRIQQLQQQIHLAERNRDGRYGRDDDRDGRDWRDGRDGRDWDGGRDRRDNRDDRRDGDRRWDDGRGR